MNASKLLETIQHLLACEKEYHLQQFLEQVRDHLNDLASSPQDGNIQRNFSGAMKQLRDSGINFLDSLTPAMMARIREINGGVYYLENQSNNIQELINNNPITPSVVAQSLSEYTAQRSDYTNRLVVTQDHLSLLGITASKPADDTGEIGFLLPRDLFSNDLAGLIKELNEIKQIVRTFSEIATGTTDPIEVREISTSDPVFFFGIPIATIILLGQAARWALSMWKEIEDIRKLRENVNSVQIKNESARLDLIERIKGIIDDSIEIGIDDESDRIISTSKITDTHRKTELDIAVHRALESMLARIERGMTLEIKFGDIKKVSGPDSVDVSELQKSELDMKDLEKSLIFPPRSKNPMLSLNQNDSPIEEPPDDSNS